MSIPDDNSHFPQTLTPDNSISWSRINRNGNRVISTLEGSVLEKFSKPGHYATYKAARYAYSTLMGTMSCSCGHSGSVQTSETGNTFADNAMYWNSHWEQIAAPILIGSILKKNSDKVAANVSIVPKKGGAGFSIIVKSTSKNSNPRTVATRASLDLAIAEGISYLYGQKSKGKAVKLESTQAVFVPAEEGSSLISLLDRASTVEEMLDALKVANEYISSASMVKLKAEEVKNRLDKTMTLTVD